jgi:hypothetical protein
MKRTIFIFVLNLLIASALLAQVGINTDSSTPHNSAMLDVKSTVKGFLPPRMTQAEMSAILNPAEGLMVFCTDCGLNGTSVIVVYMNGAWSTLAVNCILPLAPAAGVHVPSPVQIIWNWNTVSGATGYKWSLTNDFATATDMGTATTKTETGLIPNTPYTRYIWAFNSCGVSLVTSLFCQTTTLAIGQTYGGGVIFYLDGTGQHGLISATTDQGAETQWGCYGNTVGGTSTALGTGQSNTTLIVNECNEAGRAARICNDLVLNGYSDWFLPAKDELNQMYLRKIAIGGFSNNYYWSSSEGSTYNSWSQNFDEGTQGNASKDFPINVRAVRAF